MESSTGPFLCTRSWKVWRPVLNISFFPPPTKQAADAFQLQTNFCATGIVNGDYVICRSVGAEEVGGCVDVKTDPPCGSLAEV